MEIILNGTWHTWYALEHRTRHVGGPKRQGGSPLFASSAYLSPLPLPPSPRERSLLYSPVNPLPARDDVYTDSSWSCTRRLARLLQLWLLLKCQMSNGARRTFKRSPFWFKYNFAPCFLFLLKLGPFVPYDVPAYAMMIPRSMIQ